MKVCRVRLGREDHPADDAEAVRRGLRGSKDQKAVKSAFDAWFHEVLHANWKALADV